MTKYEQIRFDELKKYKNDKMALRFLEEPKLEWEIDKEGGLTEVSTEDYIPYVPGSYESLLFSQRIYYFQILKCLPERSSSKFPSGWAKKIEEDIINLVSDLSEHISKIHKDNDNIFLREDFTGFGDSLEHERCVTSVKLNKDTDTITVNILNSLDVEVFCKVPILYLDDVFLGLIMLMKDPNSSLTGLSLKKEFENGWIGKGLRTMFIKFIAANLINDSLKHQEKEEPEKKYPEQIKAAINQGVEMGIEVISELFELTPKYYDL